MQYEAFLSAIIICSLLKGYDNIEKPSPVLGEGISNVKYGSTWRDLFCHNNMLM